MQYVQIDLGALFPVNKVIVWHYNGGTRTYHNTKTQVSTDGVTWTTVFDSAVSGEYVETLAGKTHTFTQRSVRYVRDYLNGSTANSGNHWTEIEVWGTATTAYVGDYFEWNGSLQTMTRYYSAGGARVAVRNSNGSGTNGLVYLFGDHLGSTSLTADPLDGDKLSEMRYKAWGETRHTLTNAPTDRRYTGQAEEAGIGLYFYGARWYDSYLNRWTSPDSIVPLTTQGTQALDRYAYANNNPVRYNDPSGHRVDDGCSSTGCSYSTEQRRADILSQHKWLKENVRIGVINDLHALASLSNYAADLSGNCVECYVEDMGATLTGLTGWSAITEFSIQGVNWLRRRSPEGQYSTNAEYHENYRSIRGDEELMQSGYAKEYQDPAEGQNQAHHFWFYVQVGYEDNYIVALAGNLAHETVLSNGATGRSMQDFNLGEAGAAIGQMLSWGALMPSQVGLYMLEVLGR